MGQEPRRAGEGLVYYMHASLCNDVGVEITSLDEMKSESTLGVDASPKADVPQVRLSQRG
jgi:hypothetical protein